MSKHTWRSRSTLFVAASWLTICAPAYPGQPMFQPFDYGPGYGPADVEAIREARTRHYSQRQWQLSRLVENYCSANVPHCGPGPENLRFVMSRVGARPDEASFVRGRMDAVWNAHRAIQQSDRLLNDICRDFPAACVGR